MGSCSYYVWAIRYLAQVFLSFCCCKTPSPKAIFSLKEFISVHHEGISSSKLGAGTEADIMEESNYFYDLLSLLSYISVGSLVQGGTTRCELDPSISVISQKLKMLHSLPVGQSDGILSIGFLPSQMTLPC